MLIGTQYYRPPFPERRYWADDLARMRDSGLNTVQFWAVWGWIEPEPGQFRFEDYDELVERAGELGLRVVISTIAEVQPFWLPREIPGCELVDHMGHRVVSSPRVECNVGITPGGCTDHPVVRERMQRFFATIAERYAGTESVAAWDCWNENRWAVHSDGYVCYCNHTIAAFREWLRERYVDLDGLNRAWQRRYCAWDDVQPGKLPGRTYTELAEFARFLSDRAAAHMAFRRETIRGAGGGQPVFAHCASPSTFCSGGGGRWEQPLARGNDWDHADRLDGYGCSHFPFWGEAMDEDGFGLRVESVRSAARGRPMWVSELQGGSARSGFDVHRSVPAGPQQRWVWNGIARGAKAVIFWCWRDEVFGKESSGFGLAGNDGLADERLAALRRTGAILDRYGEEIDAYEPDPPRAGVFFAPANYRLEWSQYDRGNRAVQGVLGYATALERAGIPYAFVEDAHTDCLADLRVLFLPAAFCVPATAAERIQNFVRAGGTVVVETETDAYTDTGFYRESGPLRPFAAALGVRESGRRPASNAPLPVVVGGTRFELAAPDGWRTAIDPAGGEILGETAAGSPWMVGRRVGRGTVIAVGGFLGGNAFDLARAGDFDRWIESVTAAAGGAPAVSVRPSAGTQWRAGRTPDGVRYLFVMNGNNAARIDATIPAAWVPDAAGGIREIVADRAVGPVPAGDDRVVLGVEMPEWGVAAVRFAPA